ncbi:MAG TPA: xanthine dehydrogenase family protein subunit M [Ktedonobacterales bacterium]|nr:xanthine dehydrogenase family protein subunit M [Ktedonobacterales bacterium]
MIPDKFEYFAPATLPEAIALLQEHPGEAKILAGGQSLIPLMKLRLSSYPYLVDLRKVLGLAALEERDGALVIGAMARESAVEASDLVRRRYPALYETSAVVADPLVRNFATIGGNVAHADPANDHPATMLALRAEVVAEGPGGRREIPIDDFLVDTFETALTPDEVLVELRVPQPPPHTGSAYVKLERKVGDYAIAGVAAQVTLDGDTCAQIGLGLTNVGPKAIRPVDAQNFLLGKRLDEQTIREAARLAAQAADPSTDLRGPADYKRAMVRTLTTRALRTAAQRAMNGGA